MYLCAYLNSDRNKCTCEVTIWILTGTSVLGSSYLNPDQHKCAWGVFILILTSTSVLVCLFEFRPKQVYLRSDHLNPDWHKCTWKFLFKSWPAQMYLRSAYLDLHQTKVCLRSACSNFYQTNTEYVRVSCFLHFLRTNYGIIFSRSPCLYLFESLLPDQ